MVARKGHIKAGGRTVGTPNKVTGDLRKWVESLINKNLSQMEDDLSKLEPKDRLMMFEKLLQYSIPKQQSISVEAQLQAEYDAISRMLDSMPEKAIDTITEKLIALNQLNKNNYEQK